MKKKIKGYPDRLSLDKRQPEMITESYVERVYLPPIWGRQAGIRWNMTDFDYSSRAFVRRVRIPETEIEGYELVVKTSG